MHECSIDWPPSTRCEHSTEHTADVLSPPELRRPSDARRGGRGARDDGRTDDGNFNRAAARCCCECCRGGRSRIDRAVARNLGIFCLSLAPHETAHGHHTAAAEAEFTLRRSALSSNYSTKQEYSEVYTQKQEIESNAL